MPPEVLPDSHDAGSRRALPGFTATGAMLSLPGAVLPLWRYYLESDYAAIAHHFLALVAGLLAAAWAARTVMQRRGTRWTLLLGCALGTAAILALAAVPETHGAVWRLPGMWALGAATGFINSAVFQALTGMYRRNAAATVNLAGVFFGVGCAGTTLLISSVFYIYSPASTLVLVALVPAFLGLIMARAPLPRREEAPPPFWRGVVADFSRPGAILFALLLFFQFGNEWAIAGWLPIFLIQRVGLSPAVALRLLALYWLALLAGRLLGQAVLPRVSHGRLLLGSGGGAVLGCLVLAMTNNLFGATLGVLLTGFAFAIIYPVVVGRIGSAFPDYHPGIFNGIFSFALTGGMLAPAHIGYLAAWLGTGVVMLLPVFGTMMVLLLSVLIWIESRFGASAKAKSNGL